MVTASSVARPIYRDILLVGHLNGIIMVWFPCDIGSRLHSWCYDCLVALLTGFLLFLWSWGDSEGDHLGSWHPFSCISKLYGRPHSNNWLNKPKALIGLYRIDNKINESEAKHTVLFRKIRRQCIALIIETPIKNRFHLLLTRTWFGQHPLSNTIWDWYIN